MIQLMLLKNSSKIFSKIYWNWIEFFQVVVFFSNCGQCFHSPWPLLTARVFDLWWINTINSMCSMCSLIAKFPEIPIAFVRQSLIILQLKIEIFLYELHRKVSALFVLPILVFSLFLLHWPSNSPSWNYSIY